MLQKLTHKSKRGMHGLKRAHTSPRRACMGFVGRGGIYGQGGMHRLNRENNFIIYLEKMFHGEPTFFLPAINSQKV
jgi:hypothetical protein